jgi:hypothetical protein
VVTALSIPCIPPLSARVYEFVNMLFEVAGRPVLGSLPI